MMSFCLKVNVQNYKNHGFIDECDLKDQFELSIVNQIVINQNGRFDIDCSDTVTIFNVFLPLSLFHRRMLQNQKSIQI